MDFVEQKRGSSGSASSEWATTSDQHLDSKIRPRVSEKEDWINAASIDPTSNAKNPTWKPSWRRIGPLSGLFALFIGVCGILSSFAILYASNGAAVEGWRYQPAAYLAVVTAFVNGATRYAAIQGAITAWWLQAIRGSTLAKLHYNWSAMEAPWRSLISRRAINWMLLPCLASIITAIDGPLLQRASNVVLAPLHNETVALEVRIAPQLPRGYSGWFQWSEVPYQVQELSGPSYNYNIGESPDVAKAISSWTSGSSMSGFVNGCPGKCRSKIRAPALETVSCSDKTYNSNYLGLSPLENPEHTNRNPPIENFAFIASAGFIAREEELVNLTVLYSDISTGDCAGTITARSCLLRSAIGLYEVIVDDGKVALVSPSVPEIVTSSNNSLSTSGTVWPNSDVEGWSKSTLAGVTGAALARYQSMVLYLNPYPRPNATKQDVQRYYQMNEYFVSRFEIGTTADDFYAQCSGYRDPTKIVMEGLNELVFRLGVDAAKTNYSMVQETLDPGVELSQNVTGFEVGVHNVYETDFGYFFGAALVDIVCMALILPLYWGWWRLGRPVSLSPLEIAKAFDAPVLRNVGSNMWGKG